MKALLIVWTIVFGGMGVAVSHTTTPLESMDVCTAAKSKIDSINPSTKGLNGGSTVSAECVPL